MSHSWEEEIKLPRKLKMKKVFLEINVNWLSRRSEDSGETLELCIFFDKWASPMELPSKYVWLKCHQVSYFITKLYQ